MIRHPLSRFTGLSWLDGLLVFCLTVLAFLPGLFGGFLGWDDDQNFLENPGYRGLGPRQFAWMLTTYHMGHWKPLTWLTHGLDYALWGMHPLGYKAVSIALHAVAAVVFLLLAGRILALAFDRPPDGALRVGAVGATLLWALHPLRVEPVAWLSARGDIVAGLGAFLTVLAYLRAHRGTVNAESRGVETWSPTWYWASVALFALALAGKSMVVTLPAVLLVLDAYPLRRLGPAAGGWLGAAARRVYLEKAPFLILSAVAGILAVRARLEFGSLVDFGEIGWPIRVAAVLYALAFHLGKSLLPVDLSPLYDLRAAIARGPWPFVASGAVVLAITTVALARARRWPGLAATWAAYVIMLIPVSGLAQNGPQIAADRYTYLACVAWALLAGGGLAWCAAQVAAQSPRRVFARSVLALATAATVLLVSLSAWQGLVWHDSISLWSRAVAIEPGGALAHAGLGRALLGEGRPAEARAHYQQALAIFPKLPEAQMGLALISGGEGRYDEAIRYGRQALARQPRRAGFRLVMAEVLWAAGRREESLEALREARQLAPVSPLFPYVTAVKLARMGRSDEAIAALEEGHRLHRAANLPDAEGEHYAALVYASIDPPRAVAAWQRYVLALSRNPRPSALELTQFAAALAALDELAKQPSRPATPR
jgi:protein O-mannosyl-transferase